MLDISVIIPFKDKAAMTIDCVKSLLEYGPEVSEVLLVSNNSQDSELHLIKEAFKDTRHVRLVEYNHPFNYQKMNNWAVNETAGETIMFLNNDTELRPNSRGLIEKMFTKAHEPQVGITGCLLLFGDEKTIQHAGVFLMPEGLADHLYVRERYATAVRLAGTKKYPYDVREDHPMTSVTGAVNIVQREKFDAVEGFDERFIIGGGDVDLCLRLNAAGYQTWYVGGGYILHKESQSRKFIPIPYSDFYWSYLSYVKGFDTKVGDPFLAKVTKDIRVNK